MTCVEPQRMRMTRSFSHYTDCNRVYLSKSLKIFLFRMMWCLNWPHREQARSHRVMCCPKTVTDSVPVGASLLAMGPADSTQNYQMPQHLMLLKPQHALQRTQHRLRVPARKAATDPACRQFIIE